MFTTTQIKTIDAQLQRGMTPDEIAEQMSVTRYTLTQHLLQSGKRVEMVRRLVDTVPVDAPGQLVDARA